MRAALAIVALLGSAGVTRADDFYRGRNLTIVIGSPAGGIYDIAARLYARHIVNFIPGNPTAVPQNMPGAAGLRAANYLYNAAPKDGATIALSLDNMLMSPVLQPNDVKYQAGKFNWIGRGDRPTRLLYTWTASGIRTLADATKREVVTGVTAPGTSSELYPQMANALLGAKFKMVLGYEGASGLNLALDRGEIEAVGANAWINLQTTKPDWVRERKITALFQTTLTRDPDLPETPTLTELARNETDREAIAFEARAAEIGYYFFALPGSPPERIEILRDRKSTRLNSSH